jgi:hypothetical protein
MNILDDRNDTPEDELKHKIMHNMFRIQHELYADAFHVTLPRFMIIHMIIVWVQVFHTICEMIIICTIIQIYSKMLKIFEIFHIIKNRLYFIFRHLKN